jgi:hypothetical protein
MACRGSLDVRFQVLGGMGKSNGEFVQLLAALLGGLMPAHGFRFDLKFELANGLVFDLEGDEGPFVDTLHVLELNEAFHGHSLSPLQG